MNNQFSYFDVHSHLNFSQFDGDRDAVIAEMADRGIGTICVGTGLATSRECVQLAETHDHMWATVGLHPTDTAADFDADAYGVLADASDDVVGIGECGLDYYRAQHRTAEEKDRQREMFERHIQLALARDLPLMLHGRPKDGTMDAYEEMLDILELYANDATAGGKLRGHAHFFVGTVDIARRFLELGFTLGFDGPVTFARDYDEVIRFAPLDMICAETDAPFAAPEPHRGTRNTPLYVSEIVEAIAEIRGEAVERVRRATVENARRVFGVA